MNAIRSKFNALNSLSFICLCLFAIAIGVAFYGCGATKRVVAIEEAVSGCTDEVQKFVGKANGVSQEREVAVLRANSEAKQNLSMSMAQVIAASTARYSAEVEFLAAFNFAFVTSITNMAMERASDVHTIKLYDGKYTCSTELSVNRDTVLHCINRLVDGAYDYNRTQFKTIFCDELARVQPHTAQ